MGMVVGVVVAVSVVVSVVVVVVVVRVSVVRDRNLGTTTTWARHEHMEMQRKQNAHLE
jgi:hypothetical protein